MPVAIGYVEHSLTEASVAYGPWTLHQMAGRNRHDASGIVPPISTPYNPPTTAYGIPYNGYCTNGRIQTARGVNPMQPYYFPFVHGKDGYLEGFFDYRPRNEQEATVSAISLDWGKSWIFTGEALGLNPYCAADPTDPDNNNVIADGISTPYASNPANAADSGLGHAFAMSGEGVQRIYHLNRATGHIDSDQLVVHTLHRGAADPLAGLPAFTTIIYVEKQLNASTTNNCSSTPDWALTNIDTGKPRKANTDIITIRVATTTDGINFTDIGAVSGLQDPTTTAFNGIRWLGSGSIIALSNGHYGMFFGAGNCLDNDSDGFHFIGYAETTNPVGNPLDLLSWSVIYGFDNPILSTDTVIDPETGETYPANRPLIDVTDADVLTPAQVAPWVPPEGYSTNFFSGRIYDPQAIYRRLDRHHRVRRLQYASAELEPGGLPHHRPLQAPLPGRLPRLAPIAVATPPRKRDPRFPESVRKTKKTKSFRARAPAREPGNYERSARNTLAKPVFIGSGPAPAGRPGTTAWYLNHFPETRGKAGAKVR
jgi:hypothetical protein